MQCQLLPEARAENWAQYCLFVPVVSVGNVGQLAADLLISTLELRKAGALHHDALLPSVGSAAFAHAPGLTTALELFFDPARKLACLQQRSPAAPGRQRELAEAQVTWIAEAGFKQVWVLGSLDAIFRTDTQLAGPQLRYWSRTPELTAAAAAAAPCPTGHLQPLEEGWFRDQPLEQRLLPPWPLLLALGPRGLACAALLTFSLEGDNEPDAYLLAGAAAAVLGLAAGGQAEGGGRGAAGAVRETVPAGGSNWLAWRAPASWQPAIRGGERAAVY